jgi:maleylacetoacetate isomerase
LHYLSNNLELNDTDKKAWYLHWLALGFRALEARLIHRKSDFAYGNEPGMAECFLIPQLYNARRFACPLDTYPQLVDIESRCTSLAAFVAAHPDQQQDKPHD